MRVAKWVKTSSAKNHDTLVATEDDHMLNDNYLIGQLSDFHFGVRAHAIVYPTKAETSTVQVANMDIDEPFTSKEPPAPAGPLLSESLMQQILDDIQSLSMPVTYAFYFIIYVNN